MRLNNQDPLLDKTKKELEENIQKSLILGGSIAFVLFVSTFIIYEILYYNLTHHPFSIHSYTIYTYLRPYIHYIAYFNWFIFTIIWGMMSLLYFYYTFSILKETNLLEETNLNQRINEQKIKKYSQIIKTYFWPRALVWKIIGIIIVVYYAYIFTQIYPILQKLPIFK